LRCAARPDPPELSDPRSANPCRRGLCVFDVLTAAVQQQCVQALCGDLFFIVVWAYELNRKVVCVPAFVVRHNLLTTKEACAHLGPLPAYSSSFQGRFLSSDA